MNTFDSAAAEKLFDRLRNEERQHTCGEEAARRYYEIHRRRFDATLQLCTRLVPRSDARVLDVGPSFFSRLLARIYPDVTTLGLCPKTDDGGQQDSATIALNIPHIVFELNQCGNPSVWPACGKTFDLIVYAETIEHLPIAPEFSLTFLGSMLAEHGILLVTTPNAATIMKRLILLIKGKNPYERIRWYAENPGHFRELTMNEILAAGSRSNLVPSFSAYYNFYKAASPLQALLKVLKPSFRDSLVVAFQKA